MSSRHAARIVLPTFLAFAALAMTWAAGPATRPDHRALRAIPGFRYTIRLTSTVRADGGSSPASTGSATGWVAAVQFAKGRGRMDITEGAAPQLFARGDCVLFDSSDFIVMHPAAKDFASMTEDIANRQAGLARSHQENALTFADVLVRLDTLGPGDPIEGQPTERYRLTASYATSYAVDVPPPQRVLVRTTTEYWIAPGVLLESNPFVHPSSAATVATAMFTPVANQMAAAMAGIGRGAPLRTTTTTRLTDASGATFETDLRMEIADLATGEIDPSALTLPRDYTESPLPGRDASTMSRDHGAKWRAPPGGGR